MYKAHRIGVVVPAYNEERFIGGVIREIPGFVDRVYVVDDGSQDRTVEATIAAAEDAQPPAASDGGLMTYGYAEEFPIESVPLSRRVAESRVVGRVVVLQHGQNRGAGGAIKTGYLAALAEDVDIVATIDADGQMDPHTLQRFLDPIIDGEADYTKGNRFAREAYWRDMPRFRLFGNVVLTLLTRIASGYWNVTDPQNGYTAISRSTLERVDVEQLFEYYGYVNDLLVRLNVAGATVTDVPLPAIYDDEESHIEYGDYIPKVSMMLLRDFLWRLRVNYSNRIGKLSAIGSALGSVIAGGRTTQALASRGSSTSGSLLDTRREESDEADRSASEE